MESCRTSRLVTATLPRSPPADVPDRYVSWTTFLSTPASLSTSSHRVLTSPSSRWLPILLIHIDDGEASTIAVAIHRGLGVATDDRKALRLASRGDTGDHTPQAMDGGIRRQRQRDSPSPARRSNSGETVGMTELDRHHEIHAEASARWSTPLHRCQYPSGIDPDGALSRRVPAATGLVNEVRVLWAFAVRTYVEGSPAQPRQLDQDGHGSAPSPRKAGRSSSETPPVAHTSSSG